MCSSGRSNPMAGDQITYTRPSRLAKRDAYLLSRYENDPAALLTAALTHRTTESFDFKTAPYAETLQRFEHVHAVMLAVAQKFPRSVLPARLKWLTVRARVVAWAPATKEGDLRILVQPNWLATTIHRYTLPDSLLSAKDVEVARYTRQAIRQEIDLARAAALADRQRQALDARKTVARLQKELADAEKLLASLNG